MSLLKVVQVHPPSVVSPACNSEHSCWPRQDLCCRVCYFFVSNVIILLTTCSSNFQAAFLAPHNQTPYQVRCPLRVGVSWKRNSFQRASLRHVDGVQRLCVSVPLSLCHPMSSLWFGVFFSDEGRPHRLSMKVFFSDEGRPHRLSMSPTT